MISQKPIVTFAKHFVVREPWFPTEADQVGNIKIKGFVISQIMPRGKRAQSELIKKEQQLNGRPGRERFDSRMRMGVGDQLFQCLPKRAETLSAHVVGAGLPTIQGQQVGIHQIMRVDKLKQPIATSNHVIIMTTPKPVEENLENAQPAFTEDRPGPDNEQPRPVFGADLTDNFFAR